MSGVRNAHRYTVLVEVQNGTNVHRTMTTVVDGLRNAEARARALVREAPHEKLRVELRNVSLGRDVWIREVRTVKRPRMKWYREWRIVFKAGELYGTGRPGAVWKVIT